jgi:pentatricopeptide repeat protein
MAKFTKEGEWQKALSIFSSLSALGLRPDTTIANAAIAACDKGGDWGRARSIFYSMELWGLQRDTITYSSAISALSKSRQWVLSVHVRLLPGAFIIFV